MNNNKDTVNTALSLEKQQEILREIIAPLIDLQDPEILIASAERARSTEHTWVSDCLMPEFQTWINSLPDEQITWLGDDCIRFAQIIADHAFPSLKTGIALAVQSLGTDNPRILAKGIFEYAKTKEPIFLASLFTFGTVQLLRGDQFAFKI